MILMRLVLATSDNIEIMMSSETGKIIEELFESLSERYQERIEESMKGSKFVLDSTDLLNYSFQKSKSK